MKIQTVPTNNVQQVWPIVERFVRNSQELGNSDGCYTSDHVLVYLTTGQWILIVAVDDDNQIQGAMTMSFINYPLHRVAFVTTTGGKGIIDKATFGQLKEIAKYHGATKIQAMARPSMARLLQTCEFKAGNTLMEHTL